MNIGEPVRRRRYEPIEEPTHAPTPQEEPAKETPSTTPEPVEPKVPAPV